MVFKTDTPQEVLLKLLKHTEYGGTLGIPALERQEHQEFKVISLAT